MKISVVFLALAVLPFNSSSIAQANFLRPRFEHLTIADGLPENSVWSIFQDHLGDLWFGTQNGLVKYDGYSVVVYQPKPGDTLSISNRWIRAIFEDHKNTLWIGTANGLNRFNRTNETFTRILPDTQDKNNTNSNYIRCIYEDSRGKLWVGTESGLKSYNDNKNILEKCFFGDSLQMPVYDIMENPASGNLYLATEREGLWEFDIKRKIALKSDVSLERMPGYIPSWILSFCWGRDSTLWMATTNGLVRLDPDRRKINYYQIISSRSYIPVNQFNSIFEDSGGMLWIGSGYSGLISFDPETEQFQINKHEQNNPSSLNNNRVWSIYEDDSGIIWAGTWGGGLNKWNRNKWKFNSLKHEPGIANSLGNNVVNSICEDQDGIIWIGTENGLDRFDRNKNSFTHYLHQSNNDNSISSNLISVVVEDPFETGVLWIGTKDAGLNKFNVKKNLSIRFQNKPETKNSLVDNSILSLIIDHLGIIWIGTSSGVSKFDQKSGIFTNFKHDPDDPRSLSEDDLRALYEDADGNIWAGTNKGGLNKLDRETGKVIRYVSLTNDREFSSIMTITAADDGNLWVGTNLSGLHLFDFAAGRTVRSLTPENGLSTNGIRGILKDESGNLWISTLNGIYKFDPLRNLVKAYRTEDGLSGNEFNRGSLLKCKDGEMFFGGVDGITVFYPHAVIDDPVPPNVVISNISLFNKPEEKLAFDGFIPELKEIKLAYNQNDLQFDFVGLHFGEPHKNQYKFILENFDDNWIDAGTQKKAIYSNLGAGDYVFRVKAANRDGTWNETGASIKIIIAPPWWATWWAYALYGLIGISLLFFLRRYELNRIQLKNQVKLDEAKLKEREETDRTKSRFFANISHEFRTPLTLILGPSENILTKTSEEETKNQARLIKKNAGRLLNLINQLLDLSKLEAGKLQLEASLNDVVSFVKGIVMSFESLAEKKNITLKVESASARIDLYFDKDKLAKILANLLSNAFKFTNEGGEITTSINQIYEQALEISVTNTGIGIPKDEIPKLFDRFYQVDSSLTREYEGSGIGLALTKELVELHKGTIDVKSEEGKWASFVVSLPLGRDHLGDDEIVKTSETFYELIEVDQDEHLPTAGAEEQVEEYSEDKTVVLVVEDNAYVRKYIKDSLGEKYQVREAVNGEEGVSTAEEIIPDLIVSDIMMPRMDGNELTRILKNDERTSHIPVILLTAKAGQESKLEGLETGADAYLTKPFDAKELQVQIKNLLNIRKKLQEKYGKGIPDKKTNIKELSDLDERFMSKALEVIENHMAEEEFSIEEFDRELGMGRVQIYRKLKAITGKSPSRYIRTLRLARAKQWIEEKKGNISEVAYSVGFGSPSYFTKCFKEEFGFPPSDLVI